MYASQFVERSGRGSVAGDHYHPGSLGDQASGDRVGPHADLGQVAIPVGSERLVREVEQRRLRQQLPGLSEHRKTADPRIEHADRHHGHHLSRSAGW